MKRLLIIGDQEVALSRFSNLAESLGISSSTAQNLDEAIFLILQGLSDFILYDFNGISEKNFEIYKSIRFYFPEIPAIILSAPSTPPESISRLDTDHVLPPGASDKQLRNALSEIASDSNLRKIYEVLASYRQIFDSIQDIIQVVDANHTILRTNNSIFVRQGITPEHITRDHFLEILGKKCHQLIFNRDKPCDEYGDVCPLCLIKGQKTSSESLIHHANRFYQINITLIQSSTSQIHRYVEIVRDITQQKTAELNREFSVVMSQFLDRLVAELLNLSYSKLNNAISNALIEISKFTGMDQSYLFLCELGYRDCVLFSEWRSETAQKRLPETSFNLLGIPELFKSLSNSTSTTNAIYIPVFKELETIDEYAYFHEREWKTLLMVPVTLSESSVGILGFHSFFEHQIWSEDIVSLLKIFGEILGSLMQKARTEEALRRSEARYRRLTENSPDMVWRFNRTGIIDYVSPSVERILGYKRKEFLKSHIQKYFLSGTNNQLYNIWQKGFIGEFKMNHCMFEQDFVHKSGGIVPCELSLAVERDISTRIVAYECVLHDLTERKRIAQERSKLQSQLFQAQKMEAIGNLASGVAHEINNPIGIIIGFAEYMIDSMIDNDKWYDNVNLIYTEALRIKEITSRMMDLARSGKIAISRIDINRTISESIRLLSHKLIKRNIRVETDLDAKIPMINGNENALKQVFINLFLNAIEAIPETKKGLIFITSIRKDVKTIELTITDNGNGIPEDEIEKIFEPFHTLKENGSGLGLSISASIVSEHNGSIWAENLKKGGAKFRIHLPISLPTAPPFEGEVEKVS